ncbi:cation diffusion facilitator family transporter [Salinisphaera sp. Q1T1-3]|uniref:cation diffusion facilitator family transporter n=1 Tax=Salinisphaera sp. Q1T1-3 TaxID=2321229 RepID=UPI000E757EA8|nr:cation diffusion facilitator family transporter [Salinisphaera sp. Q1T1-3]RJS91831.1 cation transporter [Salinisphaera sp. Q1T1-3]
MITTVRYALGSVIVGIAVFALKYLAYWLTGSAALYSDALESIINIVAAGAAVAALRVSAIPPDENHPYGHTKAEYFSAVLEGVLIVVAAIAILRDAWLTLFDLQPLSAPVSGLMLNGLASVLNGIWATVLIRQGRRVRSPALSADGRHLLADVVTSVGVFAGVVLVSLTGWLWLDPAIAAIVAFNILWSGWQLVRSSLGGLMDEAVPEDELERIRHTIFDNAQGAYQAHDLRTRHAGRRTFIDFHLVVAGDMPVERAHEICDRLEQALEDDIADCVVTIHVEPEHKAEISDVYVSTGPRPTD